MKVGSAPGDAGLGTNIVEARARHLDAGITVTDNAPGTTVTLTHLRASVRSGQDTSEPV